MPTRRNATRANPTTRNHARAPNIRGGATLAPPLSHQGLPPAFHSGLGPSESKRAAFAPALITPVM